MSTELEEYYQELFQEILGAADARGLLLEDVFFEKFCDSLSDGDLGSADRAYYSRTGIRVDGYGGDPITAHGTLSLIIMDLNQGDEIKTLTNSELDPIFKRLANFVKNALKPEFRMSMEESSPAYQLADLINSRWPDISKIRMFLVSNRRLSARVDGRPADELLGVPVTYSVWDLERQFHFTTEGHGQEDIEVDLNEFGGPIPALLTSAGTGGYDAYLAVVPGVQLASIYEKWGARLLEQNVRVFLQARSNVNKGIRNTLQNEPGMFLAYNNGIAATAESVETLDTPRGVALTKLTNLQIVNGGQTTASVYAESRRKGGDLSGVFVQMKLSIVAPSLAVEMVPKISQFANSQNTVNAADFFANHPFHVRMQEFSRRLRAPSPEGAFKQTKWFYERARGQYYDEMAYLTDGKKKEFQQAYPKNQLFSKTDLAKFLNPWRGEPHIVSRGAQKNFAEFAKAIGGEWEMSDASFNESYFRRAIAKAIVFRETEKLVSEQEWYEGGYRANIVAYAIAKLASATQDMKLSVDFESIWQRQGITSRLRKALTIAAEAVNGVILDAPGNITEWAKQPACWSRVERLSIEWPEDWKSELITLEQLAEQGKEARKDQKLLNGIAAQKAVVDAGPELWRDVKEWGISKEVISQDEAEILSVAAAMPDQVPSDKQCARILKTLKRFHDEGCQIGREVL